MQIKATDFTTKAPGHEEQMNKQLLNQISKAYLKGKGAERMSLCLRVFVVEPL
jgi:hypothetical protein